MSLKGLIKSGLVEKAYIVSLVVFVISSIMMSYFVYSNTMDVTALKVIRYFTLGVAILKIVIFDLRTYSKRRMALTAIVLLLLLISGLVSGSRALLWTAIMIVAAYRVDFKKMLRCLFIWEIILVIVLMLLSITGVIPDRVYYRGGQAIRHSLGFKYSTYIPLFFLTLSTIYLFLRKEQIKLYECITIVAVAIMIYVITDTRLEPALAVILTAGLFLYNRISGETYKKMISGFAFVVVPVAVIISGFSIVLYDSNNDIWRSINGFTSGRLSLSSKVLKEYGVSVFGNNIQWVGLSNVYEGENVRSEYNAVDNAYLRLLVQFGVVALMLFACSQANLIGLARVKADYRLQLIIALFVVFSILNPHTYELAFCPFLLLLGGENEGLEKKKVGNAEK